MEWRDDEAIYPLAQDGQRHHANRQAYERHLAGRDVLGSLDFTMTLIEAEFMFIGLRG